MLNKADMFLALKIQAIFLHKKKYTQYLKRVGLRRNRWKR
jgi:hypothetical protein